MVKETENLQDPGRAAQQRGQGEQGAARQISVYGKISETTEPSRKHAYIILTPLNPTFIK